ncbi:integration host factor [bacterium]|nr:integration host factor [bacterium]
MAAKKKAKKTTKTVAKAKTTKTAAKPVKVGPIPHTSRTRTKSEIMHVIATQTGLTRKDIGSMFHALGEMMGMDIGKKGPGTFVIPGMMKVTRVHKPATKARKGINPFTGEETTFKAKPARNVVKIRPLKNLKEKANH